MPAVSLPLDLTCVRCDARTILLELELPGEVRPPQVRIGTTMRCPNCGNSTVFGDVPAEVHE